MSFFIKKNKIYFISFISASCFSLTSYMPIAGLQTAAPANGNQLTVGLTAVANADSKNLAPALCPI